MCRAALCAAGVCGVVAAVAEHVGHGQRAQVPLAQEGPAGEEDGDAVVLAVEGRNVREAIAVQVACRPDQIQF